MPTRLIKDSIRVSDSINELDYFEEVVFYRLIVTCDDYGRYDGRPSILKSHLFPLRVDTISNDELMTAIRKLESLNMLMLYEVDGKPYLQLSNWERHQNVRNQKSKFPDPIKTDCYIINAPESNCKQLQTDDNKSPRNPNPNPYPNPKPSETGARDGGGDDLDLRDETPDEETRQFREVLAATQDCGWRLPSRRDEREASECIEEHGAEQTVKAILRAHERGRRTWGYVKAILEDWRAKGYVDDPSAKAQSPPKQEIKPMTPEQKQAFEEAMKRGEPRKPK